MTDPQKCCCGKGAKIESDASVFGQLGWRISCKNCGFFRSAIDRDQAIDLWNVWQRDKLLSWRNALKCIAPLTKSDVSDAALRRRCDLLDLLSGAIEDGL